MEEAVRAKEDQNQPQLEEYRRLGAATLGPWASNIWRHDPRHLGFLLARYKFVAKMLSGKAQVLEVGCGDAVGIPVILQTVGRVHCVDFEPLVLNDAEERFRREGNPNASFEVHDVTETRVEGPFDAAFALDVIEHIPKAKESKFVDNIADSLVQHGVLVMGTPNITSSQYASAASQAGHINLKSADTLKELLAKRFHNVFIFSMNDEIVHTGFYQLAHYLLAMGVGVKRTGETEPRSFPGRQA